MASSQGLLQGSMDTLAACNRFPPHLVPARGQTCSSAEREQSLARWPC